MKIPSKMIVASLGDYSRNWGEEKVKRFEYENLKVSQEGSH